MKMWSSSELKQLTNGYLSGVSIKELARRLNRTPTALNKALTRFGIRHQRKPKRITFWNAFGDADLKTYSPQTAIARFDRRYRKHQRELCSRWVPMDQVVSILESKGHIVQLLKAMENPRQSLYLFDGKPLPALRLVFIANRYRLERNEGPFYVHGVTE